MSRASDVTSAAPLLTTAAELLAATARHGIELTAPDGKLDSTGLDFLVVHATDATGAPWIVRTPRRPDVVASAQVEARVLALVRAHLPVAVPHWRVHAPEVIAYPRIAGTPAISITEHAPQWNVIDPAALSPVFVDSFARTLVALQAIPLDEARAAGVPERSTDQVREQYARAADVAREALAPSDALWARWQRWLAASEGWPSHLAMTHGDLHPGHMLLAASGELVGVLDWTEGLFTDPSTDLAMYLGCFGRPALDQLLARFAAHGGRTWPGLADHAAERWAFFPALGAEWALRTGNASVLEQVRAQVAELGE